jgi:CubicO group peptidase (beta-lactamase class C family)
MAMNRREGVCWVALFAALAGMVACGGPSAAGVGESSDSDSVGSVDERIARVARGLSPPLEIEGEEAQRWQIGERMERFAVPAVSVAVIDDGRLAWAHAWGIKQAGGDEPVTTETMFQAGSVSKPVTALLALTLVSDGTLQLDRPINQVLRSWQVPDNELTRQVPVTLRHVISHQAGFTPFAYGIGRSEGSMPGMAELLRGGIRDWPVVTVEFLPGSRHSYSNSGYCVLQLVLEDASGLSLHELAEHRLFGPLGMSWSTFHEPLAAQLLATVASGHTREQRASGRRPVPVTGKARIAPAATGGLWSTPTDLARLVVEVLRAWRGESEQLITHALAREFMTPQADNAGLGIYVEEEGQGLRVRHGGHMDGFITHMVFYPNAGKGAILMASSDGGSWLNQELIAAIAREHAWPGYPVRRRIATVSAEQMRELVGDYSLDAFPDTVFTVRMKGGALEGQINQYPPFELTPTTEQDLFVLPRESLEILFRRTDGRVTKVTLRRAGDAGNAYTRKVASAVNGPDAP